MSKWCDNKLMIWGENEEIEHFKRRVMGNRAVYSEDVVKDQKSILTLHSLVPVPHDILKAGYNKDGYQWQIEQWGTKWDVSDNVEITEEEENYITYEFATGWHPPIEWIKKVGKMFPSLVFGLSFLDLGKLFAGYIIIEEGEKILQALYSNGPDFWAFVEKEFNLNRQDF